MSQQINRTAVQEWVKWQVLTAGIFLINGSAFTFKYPYGTFPWSDQISFYLGPTIAYGPSNTTEGARYFLGPATPVFGPTLPLVGIVAMAGAVLCLILESDLFSCLASVHKHSLLKALFYLPLGLYTINQFTCIQPATFLIISGLLLIYDGFAPAPAVLPK